jgi:hypothetical protein
MRTNLMTRASVVTSMSVPSSPGMKTMAKTEAALQKFVSLRDQLLACSIFAKSLMLMLKL